MDDEEGDEIIFSARFACPHCGHSISELEPKLFSFNNPAGACPTCDGLGVKQFFDAKRLVNGELTLAEGAIRGWDRRNVYYFQMLGSLAAHYGFSLEEPFDELAAEHQKVILFGSGTQSVDFKYLNDRGDIVKRSHPFEGIIPNLERRYRETESASVREELAKFLSTQPCPDCRGTRLRREARHVWVGERTLPAVTGLPVGDACDYFGGMHLTGRRGEIAEKILKEIRERLQFLVNVGLDYLTLDRSADTLSGGEAQRIRLATQIGSGLVGVLYVLDEPSAGLHPSEARQLMTVLRRLVDEAILRHHPHAAEAENPALALYEAVIAAQAELVARWMLVGFVHGVMNTDNMTLSGETIDYGPCAFTERFDGTACYSSIDRQRRYAFGNQPNIIAWNMARLAEALYPLLGADTVDGYVKTVQAEWGTAWQRWIGDDHEGLNAAADITTYNREHGINGEPGPIFIPRNQMLQDAIDAAELHGDYTRYHELLAAVSDPYNEKAGPEWMARPEGQLPYVTFCGT